MFTKSSQYKAWWKCKKCGYSWLTTIDHRVYGTNCPKCMRKKADEKRHTPNKPLQSALLREAFSFAFSIVFTNLILIIIDIAASFSHLAVSSNSNCIYQPDPADIYRL